MIEKFLNFIFYFLFHYRVEKNKMAMRNEELTKFYFDIYDYVFQYLIYTTRLREYNTIGGSGSISDDNGIIKPIPIQPFRYTPTSVHVPPKLPVVEQPSSIVRANPVLNSILTRKSTIERRVNTNNYYNKISTKVGYLENFVFKKPYPIKK